MKTSTLILTLLALFALSLCAAAQTFATNVPSVTLSGDPKNPLMTNRSSKSVVAALLRYDRSDGDFQMLQQMFVMGGELAAGASQVFNGLSTREARLVIAAKVDAVIFSDGEFQGPQDQYSTHFQMNMETNFQAMKRAFSFAQAKEWAKLEAQSKERGPGFWGAAAATKLLDIHNAGGDINKLGQYGKLPTVTWRSGGRANIFQKAILAFLGMFETTVHAQSNPYNNVQPYP